MTCGLFQRTLGCENEEVDNDERVFGVGMVAIVELQNRKAIIPVGRTIITCNVLTSQRR